MGSTFTSTAIDIKVISVPLEPCRLSWRNSVSTELAIPDVSLLPDYSPVDRALERQLPLPCGSTFFSIADLQFSRQTTQNRARPPFLSAFQPPLTRTIWAKKNPCTWQGGFKNDWMVNSRLGDCSTRSSCGQSTIRTHRWRDNLHIQYIHLGGAGSS